jgi:hypothetical protein
MFWEVNHLKLRLQPNHVPVHKTHSAKVKKMKTATLLHRELLLTCRLSEQLFFLYLALAANSGNKR